MIKTLQSSADYNAEKAKFKSMTLEQKDKYLIAPSRNNITEAISLQGSAKEIADKYNDWALKLYIKRIAAYVSFFDVLTTREKEVYASELELLIKCSTLNEARSLIQEFQHRQSFMELEQSFRIITEFVHPRKSRMPLNNSTGLTYITISQGCDEKRLPRISYGYNGLQFDAFLYNEEYIDFLRYRYVFNYNRKIPRKDWAKFAFHPRYWDYAQKVSRANNREQIQTTARQNEDSAAHISASLSDDNDVSAAAGYDVYYHFPCEWNEWCEEQIKNRF